MFPLIDFPYDFNAYEPYIDARTMKLHYTKHYQAYLDNFNKAIAETEIDNKKTLMYIITNISKTNENIRNNAGGYHNHTLFWSMLIPTSKKTEPQGATQRVIASRYGDFANFKQEFTKVALSSFGSGWIWLCRKKANELFICTTPNQDNPSMDIIDQEKRGVPILGLDLWEHAYYLQYQNRRAEYIEAFWHLVNWQMVDERFQSASF